MADLEERAPKPLHLIVGMMGLKDAGGFLSAFRGLASHVVTVPIPGAHEAPHAPEALAETAREVGLKAESVSDVGAALKRTDAYEPGPKRILICGSLVPRRTRARPAGRRRAASELAPFRRNSIIRQRRVTWGTGATCARGYVSGRTNFPGRVHGRTLRNLSRHPQPSVCAGAAEPCHRAQSQRRGRLRGARRRLRGRRRLQARSCRLCACHRTR